MDGDFGGIQNLRAWNAPARKLHLEKALLYANDKKYTVIECVDAAILKLLSLQFFNWNFTPYEYIVSDGSPKKTVLFTSQNPYKTVFVNIHGDIFPTESSLFAFSTGKVYRKTGTTEYT